MIIPEFREQLWVVGYDGDAYKAIVTMHLFLLLIERAALEIAWRIFFDTSIFFAHHFDHCYFSLLWFPFFCYINIIYLLFLSKHSQPNPLPTYSHSFIPEGRAPTSSQPLTVGSITHLLPFQARIFVLSPLLPPCLGRAPCSCPQSCLVILLQIPSQASS